MFPTHIVLLLFWGPSGSWDECEIQVLARKGTASYMNESFGFNIPPHKDYGRGFGRSGTTSRDHDLIAGRSSTST
jgi:hypothetical protein